MFAHHRSEPAGTCDDGHVDGKLKVVLVEDWFHEDMVSRQKGLIVPNELIVDVCELAAVLAVPQIEHVQGDEGGPGGIVKREGPAAPQTVDGPFGMPGASEVYAGKGGGIGSDVRRCTACHDEKGRTSHETSMEGDSHGPISAAVTMNSDPQSKVPPWTRQVGEGGIPGAVGPRPIRRVMDPWWSSLCILLSVSLLVACATGPSGPSRATELRERFNVRDLVDVPYPPDNPRNAVRIELGRLLFFDPILSGERDVACGTCHHPEFGFADGRQFAAGVSGRGLGPDRTVSVSAVTGDPVALVPRNSPTILNAALAGDATGTPSADGAMFWDGRAEGLEGQMLVPLASREEMRGDAYAADVAVDSVLARLRDIDDYVSRFLMAFPEETAALTGPDEDIVTASTLARAVAAYERELTTGNSAYDRFARGDDEVLSPEQLDGLEVFFTKGKCFVCHNGPMLSNFAFLVTGVPQDGPGKNTVPGDDLGRAEHTGREADRYAFRVPSLRNVAVTGPYMHDGVFATLEEVVGFYDDGARPRHPMVTEDRLEVALRVPLDLTDDEIAALVAFLESLTDPPEDLDPMLLTVPEAVPSGLEPVFGVGAILRHE